MPGGHAELPPAMGFTLSRVLHDVSHIRQVDIDELRRPDEGGDANDGLPRNFIRCKERLLDGGVRGQHRLWTRSRQKAEAGERGGVSISGFGGAGFSAGSKRTGRNQGPQRERLP